MKPIPFLTTPGVYGKVKEKDDDGEIEIKKKHNKNVLFFALLGLCCKKKLRVALFLAVVVVVIRCSWSML